MNRGETRKFARDEEQQLKEIRKYSSKKLLRRGDNRTRIGNIQFNESRRWRNSFIVK